MKTILKVQLVLAVPLLIAGGFFVYFIWHSVYSDLGINISELVEEKIDIDFVRQLDGTTSSEDASNLLPYAVMIENHIDARPQSGLSEARIVYEVLTEAAITRFMAIYDLSENIDQIGPVRSARPYFIDIASEYGAVYAHSGGSPEALSILRWSDNVFNLDEFFGYNTGYFTRSQDRYAPHNLYTSLDLLSAAKSHYQLNNNQDTVSWLFKDPSPIGEEVKTISINYSDTTSHQVVWNYSVDNNKYIRSQAGSRHVDSNGALIEVDNIIVQFAPTKVVDSVGRKDINLIGEGRAIVFRDGVAIAGAWHKKSAISRTQFYDELGEQIELNRGQTWVQVVPDNLEIEY